MKCKIIFNINNKPVELEYDFDSTGPLIDDDIIKALKDNPDKTLEIAKLLYESTINYRQIDNMSVAKLKTLDGLVGNCTINFIEQQPDFSGITFLDKSANVLLLNKLSLGKNENIRGRIINSQGQEVFVVKNDPDDVKKLATYLNTRKHLQESEILLEPNSMYKEQMDKIIKERNKKDNPVSSYGDLLLDFINYKSKYTNIFIDGKSAISILANIHRSIRDWALPVSYNTPFIDDLNTDLKSLDSMSKSQNQLKSNKKGDYYIGYDRLFELINNYYPSIFQSLGISNVNKFKDLLNKDINDIKDTLSKVVEVQDSVPASLLNTLFKSEPDFTFTFDRLSKHGVILHHDWETLQSKYGIGYDTIASMDIVNDNYRGYKIYKQSVDGGFRYFVSRGYLVEDSNSRSFNTQEDAQNYINNSLRFESLNKYSLLEFKLQRSAIDENGNIIYENSINLNSITTKTSLTEGQIIEVLDVPISKSTIIDTKEVQILNKPLQNFYKIINSWNIEQEIKQGIIEDLDTPEKAVTFLYKVNERLGDDRSNSEMIKQIYNQVKDASIKYYYVDKKTINHNGYTYRVIPTDPDEVVNYQKAEGKNIPVITWMSAIKQVLENQFPGVKIELLTAEQVSDLRIAKDGLVDPNIDKAFIYNGNIYINTTIAKSTDLLHEYTHIILGCLKTNPDLVENYEKLVTYISNTTQGQKLLDDLRLSYPDISEMDLREEVFSTLFSDYVRGRVTQDSKQAFYAAEKDINKITNSIFNTKIGDIREFYGETAISVFTKFNKEVAKLLRENDIDYDQIGLGRKYSNYISQQIKEGNIQEEC